MITRKQIEEILDATLEGDNPIDSAPTVVGKEECVNRLMELLKNCSIHDVNKKQILQDLLNEKEEVIMSPIRFNGVHVQKIKQVFSKYGVEFEQQF